MTQTQPKTGNWGRWGDDDERGTLNLITPEAVLAATRVVKAEPLVLPLTDTVWLRAPHDGGSLRTTRPTVDAAPRSTDPSLAKRGNKVFADLKFYDIPETVSRAVANVRSSGASFLTVHGHRSVMEAAAREKGGFGFSMAGGGSRS